jgi:hypothetical protein
MKMCFSSKLNTASINTRYFNTRKQQFPFKVFNQVLPDDKAPTLLNNLEVVPVNRSNHESYKGM